MLMLDDRGAPLALNINSMEREVRQDHHAMCIVFHHWNEKEEGKKEC